MFFFPLAYFGCEVEKGNYYFNGKNISLTKMEFEKLKNIKRTKSTSLSHNTLRYEVLGVVVLLWNKIL